ncbi:MAG: HEAT repeat domain-containing protein [Candidatus Riflebacteria bacterium]|nr:HEAT repeat domain-containing protein [Candidatus Riflebacteria bacterium]
MINKKRQELIIQNLRSISSEVRMKSIEQLAQIPTMPAEEKIRHLQVVVNDSEADVSALAQQTVAQLSGKSETKPEQSILPATDSFSFPSSGETQPTRPAAEEFFPSDLAGSRGPISEPGLPTLDEEPITQPSQFSQQPTPFVQPAAQSTSFSPQSEPLLPPKPIAPPMVESVLDTFVDDPPDPTLPNLAKLTSTPDMLAHIQDLAGNKPSGHVTQLLVLARSGIEEVALTALQALLNLKDSRFSQEILKMLSEDQFSSQRRFLMLKIILESDRPLHVPTLEQILLREKDVIVKSGLVKVYARSNGGYGVATLITCLQDQDARVRANTVEVIEEQNISGCEQKIVEMLQDPENRVKVNAAKYLVKNGYQQAFMTLRNMLVSSEVWLRDSVIFALGEIGDQPSLTLLKAALKDPNQGIRLSVLKALARINNNMARQVLRAASGDPDPVVVQVANSLSEKIKNTPVREDIRYTPNAALGGAPLAPRPDVAPPQPPQSQALPVPPQAPAIFPPRIEVEQPTALPQIPIVPQQQVAVPRPVVVQQAPVAPPPTVAPPQPAWSEPPVQPAVRAEIVKPIAPALPEIPQAPRPRPSIPGMPDFAKSRAADMYVKLCSDNVDEQRAGSRDIAFILGEDQMLLLKKAVTMSDESIRINAVKILSRKKTPDAKALLEQLTSDHNETVRSLAEKALVMLK